jgi:hypothetical protein
MMLPLTLSVLMAVFVNPPPPVAVFPLNSLPFPNPTEGVILSPIPGQPAEKAGMQPGEVLLAINE